MCLNDEPEKPNKDELATMGVDRDQCGSCGLYLWLQMMSEWQPLDGKCRIGIKAGALRADTPKCDHFLERGDL